MRKSDEHLTDKERLIVVAIILIGVIGVWVIHG